MKERTFLKKLNSQINRDGAFTSDILFEMLMEEKSLAVAKKIGIFSAFFRKFQKVKSAKEIIQDNFEEILNKATKENISTILEMFMQNEELQPVIKENFMSILARINVVQNEEQDGQKNNDTEEGYRDCNKTKKYDSHSKSGKTKISDEISKLFFVRFKSVPGADEFIMENIDSIIQKIDLSSVPHLKGISEEIDEKLNSKLKNNKMQIIREMLDDSIGLKGKRTEEREQLLDDYVPMIMIIVDRLLKSEKVRMLDIELKGEGTYSRVYKIGEKVLKIGNPRETYKMPNHPRILQPLTRTNLFDEKENNRIFACVEISDMIDSLSDKEKEDTEKLYQIYKELRNDGIIWTDARFANVGKLRRPNLPSLEGEERYVAPQSVGMNGNMQENVLDTGEWVIIDTDYIYSEEDITRAIWPSNSKSNKFEKRWLRESQNEFQENKSERSNQER